MSFNQPWYQQQWQQAQQQSRFMHQVQDGARHAHKQQLDQIQREGQEISRRAAEMRRYRNAPMSGVEKVFGFIVWLAIMAFIIALFVANV
jgi:cell division protein FtsL